MSNQITKRILVGILTVAMIGQAIPAHGDSLTISSGNIGVEIYGLKASLTDAAGNTVEPLNYNGSVYLPIRGVAQAFGLSVTYEASTKVVALTGTVQTAQPAAAAGTPPTGTPPTGGTEGANYTLGSTAVSKQIEAVFDTIIVSLNGEPIVLKDAAGKPLTPFNYNGTIYLPVRGVSEALGLTVAYDSATATVKLGNESTGSASVTGTAKASGTSEITVNAKTESLLDKTITADGADESAIKVTGAGTLTVNGAVILKSGATSSEESSNFYGLNAALLAEAGSQVTLKDTSITTTGDGANAVFSTGDGSVVKVSDVTIKTTANSSRGLDATYNGTIIADNVTIETAGAHCGALATDRGEGTVTVSNSTAKTAGEGSPGIYSTGAITVSKSTLSASGSEAAVVEGKNSITLTDTVLSGAKKWGVMIYQSFSGDAGVGVGTFSMTGGTLTALEGPLFYSTNTHAVITLKNAELKGASGILLKAGANQWGTKGSNGSTVSLEAASQTLSGDVIADEISSADIVLKEKSVLKGTIDGSNTAKEVLLTLLDGSSWSVTGTSYLSGLTLSDNDLNLIDDNGNTVYYDADNAANSWLGGTAHSLQDGGKLVPVK